ncbi:MAG: VOC family protein [Chlorobiaceae bacterium]
MATEHNPVSWFEIPVNDMTRAKAFYEAVTQLSLEEHEMNELQMAWFPMSETGSGAAGSLVRGEMQKPSLAGTLIYFSTPDIDSALERVKKNGGNVISKKTGIGEYGFIAFFEDTEGNRIGLHTPPAGM